MHQPLAVYATVRLPTPLTIDRLGSGFGLRGRPDDDLEESKQLFSAGRAAEEEDDETEFVDDKQVLITLQVGLGTQENLTLYGRIE